MRNSSFRENFICTRKESHEGCVALRFCLPQVTARQALLGYGQRFNFVTLQALLGLDPKAQLQSTLDPVNPFVVPAIALDVAQLQKTQPKTPAPLVLVQPFQPIGDLLVLVVQDWAVALARLADLKERQDELMLTHCRTTAFMAISHF